MLYYSLLAVMKQEHEANIKCRKHGHSPEQHLPWNNGNYARWMLIADN